MNISPTLQRTLSRSAMKLQKYSPQILTAVGIVGLVTAGVLAAKNTLKLEETLDTARNRIDLVKNHEAATQQDVNKAYIHNTLDLAKLYWAPTTLAVGSTVAILAAHNILHKRNIAVIAAYKGLEQAFSDYRKRVIDEYGAEADEKFRYGIRDVVEIDENGKKVKSQTIDKPVGDYIMEFGPDTTDCWTGTFEHNLFYVTRGQQWFNDQLQVKGHVFLQDVTRYLGFPDSKVGAVTGWIYGKNTGDDYIDFGIKDLQESHGLILLNFNVDGVIIDRL